MAKNYSVMNVGTFGKDLEAAGRIMAEKELGLTGCELSFNCSAPEQFLPFVHAHKDNEEVYIVLSGKGKFMADGEEFEVKEGSVVRVAPLVGRAIKAEGGKLTYICIQASAGSLKQATMDDAAVCEEKASWMK